MENQITHMDKHEKTIIRRSEIIDEVFHNWLNSGGARNLVRSLDYHRWEEGLLHDVSYHIMVESLKMNIYDIVLNPTDEMKIIHSNLCNFIRNRHRDKMRDKHRFYKNRFRETHHR